MTGYSWGRHALTKAGQGVTRENKPLVQKVSSKNVVSHFKIFSYGQAITESYGTTQAFKP